eukprot:gnl/MRDRNA2_/MRDRNA2_18098_c0_seq1.p1 gnl/MRDRNA2_/MRDRNA2_18098_c0~~gnl/MRDRNA2_/MRDRNA2_18098_c0_seq1.p1  ORF type:complete len:239 (+),score=48.85 gnl/MRDRNA2_/MRDRNA2_18098_c0_seq1:56-772(+)
MFAGFSCIFVALSWDIVAGKPFDYLKEIRGKGPSNHHINGSPWAKGQRSLGQPQDVDKSVEAMHAAVVTSEVPRIPVSRPKSQPVPIAPKPRVRSLASRLRHSSSDGAPAPAPGPAPGPAPWTDDPEWMLDGARGDKTKTVPITDELTGLESNPVAEQGFHGPKVQHDDMETMTGDWNREFGPNGPSNLWEACKTNPGNYWCKQHKDALWHLSGPPKSGSQPTLTSLCFALLAALFCV